ncbi:hypothetical protein LK09_15560 [Microbacterium mangrovi]|uniref:Uncharacterized protein n=1 Tax=Microbacterium mangrovi TaxID=1348253 RepID=A0A0B2A3N2_9MICO|nr:DUF6069 family protein [Microbacterium mangrovi]KHK96389.1 hypothetical protein LK09_15560 [Microbacterium mangrovi]
MTSTGTAATARSPILTFFRIDLPGARCQPRAWRFLVATLVAVVGSVAACAVLAQVGMLAYPSTRGYDHFRFADYTKLTVIGVVIASLGWPLAAALSSRARRLYFWAAVAVTVVSFAPDGWILIHGQSPAGVFILAVMHVAVAVVTYWSLVLIAPQHDREPASR